MTNIRSFLRRELAVLLACFLRVTDAFACTLCICIFCIPNDANNNTNINTNNNINFNNNCNINNNTNVNSTSNSTFISNCNCNWNSNTNTNRRCLRPGAYVRLTPESHTHPHTKKGNHGKGIPKGEPQGFPPSVIFTERPTCGILWIDRMVGQFMKNTKVALMKERDEVAFQQRKARIMEACFSCYAERGLNGTGIQALAEACGLSKASLYTYFGSLDELIVESTAYCMSRVEDEFMALAPTCPEDIGRFIREVPAWTAEHHGKKYRLMYQVYTHPKYIEHGRAFFRGVDERYRAYAAQLSPVLGLPCDELTSFIFIFVRAVVHYAMFGDEYYLQSQLRGLQEAIGLLRPRPAP